ncbi:MAG: hypothetical protein R3290_11575 [Acidimicrobiia bacterium]|nr:hypothetical protein [Acidimicrobiia bacterium]
MIRSRALFAIAAIALVAAACGTGSGDAQVLRYGYAPGDALTYDVSAAVEGGLTVQGPLEPGVTEGSADIDVAVDMRVGYEVLEGDDPTISVVRITQEFTGLSGSVSGMGEDRTLSDADLEGLEPITVEISVDETGEIVSASVDGQEVPLDRMLDFGALSEGGLDDFAGLGSQLLNPGHFGPELPTDAVGVGDEWTTEKTSAPLGLDVSQQTTHRIAGEETVGGRTTLRIESTVTTEALELGLAELLEGFLGDLEGGLGGDLGGDDDFGFAPEDVAAFLEAMGLELRFVLAGSEGTATTWFDPADGLVVRHTATNPVDLSVSVTGIPDTGDVSLDAEFTITQDATLVE